jgi:hypothetical protein
MTECEEESMKSTAEVLEFVEAHILHRLARPRMYAGTPAMLEEALICFECVRSFIADPSPGVRLTSIGNYGAFLTDQGCGVNTFCGFHLDLPEDELFERLAQFWRQYLASPLRPPCPTG